jgi:hypothetical protein
MVNLRDGRGAKAASHEYPGQVPTWPLQCYKLLRRRRVRAGANEYLCYVLTVTRLQADIDHCAGSAVGVTMTQTG